MSSSVQFLSGFPRHTIPNKYSKSRRTRLKKYTIMVRDSEVNIHSFLNTQILRFLSTFCQTDQNLVKLTKCHTHQRFGLSCSKLTTSLVDETLKFQTYCTQKCCHFFCRENVTSFCSAKLLTIFQQKYYWS